MRVQGAVVREQGQTFAVVIVKPHVIQNRGEAADAIRNFTPVFGVPVVLMAQDSRGRPTYYGRDDIASFLANVPLQAIPWREYMQRDNYDGRLATIKLAKLSGHRVAIGTLLVLVSFGKRVSWRQLL